jgi:hypothetical protein
MLIFVYVFSLYPSGYFVMGGPFYTKGLIKQQGVVLLDVQSVEEFEVIFELRDVSFSFMISFFGITLGVL